MRVTYGPKPACYVLKPGESTHRTIEVVEGRAFVDYNHAGELIAVAVEEPLSPEEVWHLVNRIILSIGGSRGS